MSRSLGAKALIVLVSVVVAFLLPAASGPFCAVYGPATAFRAIREALQAQQSIMLCGLGALAVFLTGFGAFLSWRSSSVPTADLKPVEYLALRC
jgi:hypothetical protein